MRNPKGSQPENNPEKLKARTISWRAFVLEVKLRIIGFNRKNEAMILVGSLSEP